MWICPILSWIRSKAPTLHVSCVGLSILSSAQRVLQSHQLGLLGSHVRSPAMSGHETLEWETAFLGILCKCMQMYNFNVWLPLTTSFKQSFSRRFQKRLPSWRICIWIRLPEQNFKKIKIVLVQIKPKKNKAQLNQSPESPNAASLQATSYTAWLVIHSQTSHCVV